MSQAVFALLRHSFLSQCLDQSAESSASEAFRSPVKSESRRPTLSPNALQHSRTNIGPDLQTPDADTAADSGPLAGRPQADEPVIQGGYTSEESSAVPSIASFPVTSPIVIAGTASPAELSGTTVNSPSQDTFPLLEEVDRSLLPSDQPSSTRPAYPYHPAVASPSPTSTSVTQTIVPAAMADSQFAKQQAEAITQIANYLTIAVPGTTIDTRKIRDGGTFVWDAVDSAFAPTQALQAEAKLVDSIIPLSNVMIGNTGKSVARSYARALDCLVARPATVHTDAGGSAMRSPGNAVYDNAMRYLTTVDSDTGLTKVDLYIQKQAAWAHSQDAWDKAKINARKDATSRLPKDVVGQNQDFDDWNQANYRKFKFAVQGRYIDWVTKGYKFEVEQNFKLTKRKGIVDVDSIMARVEASKESLRNSTVVEVDGSNKVNLVSLTPKNWATLCKMKEDGWFARNGDYTLEQLNAEIDRLSRLLVSYKVMGSAMGYTIAPDLTVSDPDATKVTYPVDLPGEAPDTKGPSDNLQTAYADLYTKSALLSAVNRKLEGKTPSELEDDPAWKSANDALNTSRFALRRALDDQQHAQSDHTKRSMASMKDTDTQNAIKFWLSDMLHRTNASINKLEGLRKTKSQMQPPRPPVIAGATAKDPKKANDQTPNGTTNAETGDVYPDHATTGSTTGTNPSSGALPQAETTSDPWVSVNASFSASDQSSVSSASSWGMSVGGGAGWGPWSVGGAYSHDQSSSDFSSDMASCDVSISFSCLVVNIGRPWLYGELFADSELDAARDILLSPGPQQMKAWMAAQTNEDGTFDPAAIASLSDYSMFPAYPTSFVVAADTTIEFHGNTQHIEKHFSAISNAGSVSVGYGPFSVSSSFHQSSSRQSFQMQSTATGCRLTFGAPQIIGWVSQILPALPRLEGYEPIVQNAGTWKAQA
ncbi:hypothetical protein LTR37_009350 [Vermiconidia calcicola]|uniref:Uncharacterized protein n=1 Tax=Vermiconidia calcicola TaxID=1690605 RepID=A0ACC3N9E7_9PEZI|nr:hypothetical protein LTR37_009350 [Vermiconidia calcicola]